MLLSRRIGRPDSLRYLVAPVLCLIALAHGCGKETAPKVDIAGRTSALTASDGGVDAGRAPNDDVVARASEAEGIEYYLLGEPDYSTDPGDVRAVGASAPSTSMDAGPEFDAGEGDSGTLDGGSASASSGTPRRRLRSLTTTAITTQAADPNFDIEVHTCASASGWTRTVTDKAIVTIQAGGTARGWDLAFTRTLNSTSRFAFLWEGTNIADLESIKLEIRGTGGWCIDRVALRWYGPNRAAVANPQIVWAWTSATAQSSGTYVHGHSTTGAIYLDNSAASAPASFVRFTLPTFTVRANASRCQGSSDPLQRQLRGFCVNTCSATDAAGTNIKVSVKHEGLWDFLSIDGAAATVSSALNASSDNFCAVRQIEQVALLSDTTDQWKVCRVTYHDFTLSASASPQPGCGYVSKWNTSAFGERWTSTATGYAYYVPSNPVVDECATNCVTARQGFGLAVDSRVKSCLNGTVTTDTTCDGVDDDCDGVADDDWRPALAAACTGQCQAKATCGGATGVTCGAPVTEVPGNGLNDDCDTRTDEVNPQAACVTDVQCDVGFVCQVGFCVAPHCANGERDEGAKEEGRDCGGPDCKPCDGVSGCDDACRVGDIVTPTIDTMQFSSGTFTRASSATYEAAPGQLQTAPTNELRWITVEGKRFALFEGASTNVLRWSEKLDHAPEWAVPATSAMAITVNSMAAPDGLATAELLQSAGTPSRSPTQLQSLAASPWSLSYFAKNVLIDFDYLPRARAFVVDASNKALASREWQIEDAWGRVDTSFVVPTAGPITIGISHVADWPVAGVKAITAPDFGLWGAQAESLPFPTSYIPTTSAAASRPADVLEFTKAPDWLNKSPWEILVRPEFSSNELIPGWTHTLLSATTGFSIAIVPGSTAGKARVQARSAAGATYQSSDLTWPRGAVLRLVFDVATTKIEISGVGEGTVSFKATALSFAATNLRIGGAYRKADEAFAAIAEPRRLAEPTKCTIDPSCTCGDGKLANGEACDPALTSSCDSECKPTSVVRCEDDSGCPNGQVCKDGVAQNFGFAASAKVCVLPVCPSSDLAYCGTLESPCGTCPRVPHCENKQCGDDPSDGAGGLCSGFCDPGEAGCRSDLDCQSGQFCWQGQAWRFGGAANANVCAPAACDDFDPRRLDCGVTSSPCGLCDPAVATTCLDGILCRKQPLPECPDGQLNLSGACIPNVAFPASDDVDTAAVGALPGSFSVTPSGTAHYSIPINLPPGRGGLTPSLSLNYDSSHGNSMLGLGWGLSGLSQINACPKTIAQDGYIDGTVGLCVDGARLVPVAYDSGRNITEWRTEFDSFTTYETWGNHFRRDTTTEPIRFIRARTKDGLALTYGESWDAPAQSGRMETGPVRPLFLEANQPLGAYAWGLTSMRDRAGNEVRVSYKKFSRDSELQDELEDVELLPQWIGYNFTRDGAATIEVTFEYRNDGGPSCDDASGYGCEDTRADAIRGYSLGQRQERTRLLRAIVVNVHGNPTRAYRLRKKALANGLATVGSVTECSIDRFSRESCRPATQFAYHAIESQSPQAFEPRFSARGTARMPLDWNGDGQTDFAIWSTYSQQVGSGDGTLYVYVMSGSTYTLDDVFPLKELVTSERDDQGLKALHSIKDLDGDGRQELLVHTMDDLWVFQQGKEPRRLRLHYEADSGATLSVAFYGDDVVAADLNGDGLQDFVLCEKFDQGQGKTRVFIAEANYQYSQRAVVPGNSLCSAFEISGDYPSLLDGYTVNDSFGREYIARRVDDRFELFGEIGKGQFGSIDLDMPAFRETYYPPDGRGNVPLPDDPEGVTVEEEFSLFVLDYNGDGLRDLATIDLRRLANVGAYLRISENTGRFAHGAPFVHRDTAYISRGYSRLSLSDRDGDGRQELLALAVPEGSSVPSQLVVYDLDDAKTVLISPDVTSFSVVDYNGDGASDIVTRKTNDQMLVYPGPSAHGGLLKSVSTRQTADAVPTRVSVDYSTGASGIYTVLPELASDGLTRPAWGLSRPVVSSYESAVPANRAWSGDEQDYPALQRDRMEFWYRGGLYSQNGGWLGFNTIITQRKDPSSVRSIITEQRDQRSVEWGEDGPFFARDSSLAGTGYGYRFFPYLSVATDAWVLTKVDGNALTRNEPVTRESRTQRQPEVLRSDRGLPLVNLKQVDEIITEWASTGGERDPLVNHVRTTTKLDKYGNVKSSEVTWPLEDGGGPVEKVTTTYAYESDASRVAEWQVDLPDTVTRSSRDPSASSAVNASSTTSYHFRRDGLLERVVQNPLAGADELTVTLTRDDPWNNVTSILAQAGTNPGVPAPAARFTSFAYDTLGVFVETTQNPEGHVETVQTSPADGLPRMHRDANQVVTRWVVDGFGRVVQENRETEGVSTTYSYQPASYFVDLSWDLGNGVVGVRHAVNAALKVERTTSVRDSTYTSLDTTLFDPVGRVVQQTSLGARAGQVVGREYDYDSFGRLRCATRPHLYGDTTQGMNCFEYDNLDRQVRETRADGRVLETYYASSATYDVAFKSSPFTWIEQTKSPGQKLRTYYSNARGNLVESREGDTATRYAYGAAGALRSTQDPAGNETTIVPDRFGRPVIVTDKDSGTRIYQYNGYGELRLSLASGEATSFERDGLGRITASITSDGVVRSTWDTLLGADGVRRTRYGALMRTATKGVAGLSEEMAASGGHIDDYYYDGPVGSLSRVHRSILLGESGKRKELDLSYDYDELLRPEVIHYPGESGFAVKYEYDDRGFLARVSNANDAAEEFWKVEEFDQGFRPKSITLGGTMRQDLAFDPLNGSLQGFSTKAGASTLQSFQFTYDADMNLQSERRLHDANEALATFYHYDDLNRLTSLTRGQFGFPIAQFSYTKNGNLKSQTGLGTYTYGEAGESDDAPQTRPHAVRRVDGSGGAYVENRYDAFGRLYERSGALAPGGLQKFGYDAYGRLQEVVTGTSPRAIKSAWYEYSGSGDRVLQNDSDAMTTVYFGALYEHAIQDDGFLQVENLRVLVGGRVVAERVRDLDQGTESTRYLHRNFQGSVELVTDEDGEPREHHSYSAFGNPSERGPGETSWSFTGHRAEMTHGVIDMLGRFYDPKLGRFLTPDPFVPHPSSGQSFNRYSYVRNNPATLIDPTGFQDDVNTNTGEQQDGTGCRVNCGGGGPGSEVGKQTGPQTPEGSDGGPVSSNCYDGRGVQIACEGPSAPRAKPPHYDRAPSLRGSPVAETTGPLAASSTELFTSDYGSVDAMGNPTTLGPADRVPAMITAGVVGTTLLAMGGAATIPFWGEFGMWVATNYPRVASFVGITGRLAAGMNGNPVPEAPAQVAAVLDEAGQVLDDAATVLPTLAEGPGGKMLGEAVGYLRNMPGAERLAAFQKFAEQITTATRGQWTAKPFSAVNAKVFAGEGGEALVFDLAGNMFRGHLSDRAAFEFIGGGQIKVVFEALRAL